MSANAQINSAHIQSVGWGPGESPFHYTDCILNVEVLNPGCRKGQAWMINVCRLMAVGEFGV